MSCIALSVTDLFVVGLALDLTGAVFLLRGLLISPKAIARLGTWHGVEVGDTLDRCENRVDAFYGGFGLLLGFLLQGIGYVLELSGVEGGAGNDRLLGALVVGLAAVALSLLLYFATRRRVLKMTLIQVAKAREGTGDLGDEEGPQWTRQKVIKLARLAEAAGWPRLDSDQDGITRVNYIRRVFGIEVPPFPCDEP